MSHPAPQVAARVARVEQVPAAAARMAEAAAANGWEVSVTFARGTDMTAAGEVAMRTIDEIVPEQYTPTGRPKVTKVPVGPRVVDSIAVRCARDDRVLVAIWHDGRFCTALERTIGKLSSDDAKAALTAVRVPAG